MNQQCKKCFIIKPLSDFNKANISYKGKNYIRKTCVVCYAAYKASREYRERQNAYRRTDAYRAKKREYRRLERVKINIRKYEKEYAQKNVLYKVKKNLRNRLRIALKVKKWLKTTKFYEYIGCAQLELKQHLEKQFQSGMNWGNYGQWEIDHIIPLSSAKTEPELYKLCHYTNLQPLWAQDNLKKSNKLE